jgi:putative peptidoglycan lipid II flippase
LIGLVFDFGPAETEMVVWATRAFLAGLVGHAWLEVGVRSWYARQNARIPLLGSVFQIALYIPLAWLLSTLIGHTGIALADTLAFTSQAVLLLVLLQRRVPGLLEMRGTLLRAVAGALLSGIVVYGLLLAPLPLLIKVGLALAAGGLAALPFLWPELKILMRL